jgi:hypothetical protein
MNFIRLSMRPNGPKSRLQNLPPHDFRHRSTSFNILDTKVSVQISVRHAFPSRFTAQVPAVSQFVAPLRRVPQV